MGRKYIVSTLISFFLFPVQTKEISRNFRVIFDKDFAIHSSAYRLNRASHQLSLLETYTPETSVSLVAWLQELLEKTILES